MIITKVNIESIEVIQKLAYDTWPVVYKEMLSKEQLKYMLELFYSTDALNAQMKNGQQFFIANEAENPVGFASYTKESEGIFKLQKLYVLPNMHKTGIGKSLLQHVKTEMKQLNGHTMILNVNRNNPAKDYYTKLGFTIIKTVDVEIGNGYFMNDFVMSKDL